MYGYYFKAYNTGITAKREKYQHINLLVRFELDQFLGGRPSLSRPVAGELPAASVGDRPILGNRPIGPEGGRPIFGDRPIVNRPIMPNLGEKILGE